MLPTINISIPNYMQQFCKTGFDTDVCHLCRKSRPTWVDNKKKKSVIENKETNTAFIGYLNSRQALKISKLKDRCESLRIQYKRLLEYVREKLKDMYNRRKKQQQEYKQGKEERIERKRKEVTTLHEVMSENFPEERHALHFWINKYTKF